MPFLPAEILSSHTLCTHYAFLPRSKLKVQTQKGITFNPKHWLLQVVPVLI